MKRFFLLFFLICLTFEISDAAHADTIVTAINRSKFIQPKTAMVRLRLVCVQVSRGWVGRIKNTQRLTIGSIITGLKGTRLHLLGKKFEKTCNLPKFRQKPTPTPTIKTIFTNTPKPDPTRTPTPTPTATATTTPTHGGSPHHESITDIYPACASGSTIPANLYISTTGSDSNPGTEDRPLKTFSKAVSISDAGTIIQVANGRYTEGINIGVDNSILRPHPIHQGTAEHPIIIRAQTKQQVEIDLSGSPRDADVDGIYVASPYVCFAGFLIHDATNHGIQIKGQHVMVRESLFVHNGYNTVLPVDALRGSGIFTEDVGDYPIIEDNES